VTPHIYIDLNVIKTMDQAVIYVILVVLAATTTAILALLVRLLKADRGASVKVEMLGGKEGDWGEEAAPYAVTFY